MVTPSELVPRLADGGNREWHNFTAKLPANIMCGVNDMASGPYGSSPTGIRAVRSRKIMSFRRNSSTCQLHYYTGQKSGVADQKKVMEQVLRTVGNKMSLECRQFARHSHLLHTSFEERTKKRHTPLSSSPKKKKVSSISPHISRWGIAQATYWPDNEMVVTFRPGACLFPAHNPT